MPESIFKSIRNMLLATLSILVIFCVSEDAVASNESQIKDAFIEILGAVVHSSTAQELEIAFRKIGPKHLKIAREIVDAESGAKIATSLREDQKAVFTRHFKSNTNELKKASDIIMMLPYFFAVLFNEIEPDSLRSALADVPDNHIKYFSNYLDASGRAKMFSQMKTDRIEIFLEHLPVDTIIESGLKKYAGVRQYSSILYKRERVGGDLQDTEKVLLKYRDNPRAIYMLWLDGPFKGRELIFNKQQINDTDIRVRESGMLGVIPVTINADSPVARRGTNHSALEVGLEYILHLSEREMKKASSRGELTRVDHGIINLGGRKVYKLEIQFPKTDSDIYYGMRVICHIDYLLSLVIKTEVYNWQNQLQESYHYDELKLNTKFGADEFNPDNPAYNL